MSRGRGVDDVVDNGEALALEVGLSAKSPGTPTANARVQNSEQQLIFSTHRRGQITHLLHLSGLFRAIMPYVFTHYIIYSNSICFGNMLRVHVPSSRLFNQEMR